MKKKVNIRKIVVASVTVCLLVACLLCVGLGVVAATGNPVTSDSFATTENAWAGAKTENLIPTPTLPSLNTGDGKDIAAWKKNWNNTMVAAGWGSSHISGADDALQVFATTALDGSPTFAIRPAKSGTYFGGDACLGGEQGKADDGTCYRGGVSYTVILSEEDRALADDGQLRTSAKAEFYRQFAYRYYMAVTIEYFDAKGKVLGKSTKTWSELGYEDGYLSRGISAQDVPANTACIRYWFCDCGRGNARKAVKNMQAYLLDESVHTDHKDMSFEAWNSDSALPTEAGNYFLTRDVTISSSWSPVSGINLCLNGFRIIQSDNVSTIKLGSERTLNIYDCTDAGAITHASGAYGTGVETSGVFNLYGGKITGNGSATYGERGGGVLVRRGTFNMYGGEITGNQTGNARGAGVSVGNTETDSANAVFNMYGGEIYENTVVRARGSAVSIGGATTGGTYLFHFNMYGGKIYANTSSELSLTEGEGDADAVAVDKNGRFIMSGGEIVGNRNGVYVAAGVATLSGTAKIYGNGSATDVEKGGTYGYNLRLGIAEGDSRYLTIGEGGFSEGANIGVSLVSGHNDQISSGAVYVNNTDHADAECLNYLHTDDDNRKLYFDSKSQAIKISDGHRHGTTEFEAWTYSGTVDLDTSGDFYLLGDVTAEGNITVASGCTATICLNGHKLDMGDYSIINNGTLLVCDCQTSALEGVGSIEGTQTTIQNNGALSLDGGTVESTGAPAISNNSGGALNIARGEIASGASSAIADNGGTVEATEEAAVSGSTGDEAPPHVHDLSTGDCICGAGVLTFSGESEFTLATSNALKNWDGTLEYSVDLSVWTVWDGTHAIDSVDGLLYVRGVNNTSVTSGLYDGGWVLTPADENARIACSGNIMTLLNWERPSTTITASGAFACLFSGNKSLVSAPELPAVTLSEYCYQYMFRYCESLATAPDLPATVLTPNCYRGMFYTCTSLTLVPEISAVTVANYSCYDMFSGCKSIQLSKTHTDYYNTPWQLYAESAGSSGLSYMFYSTGGTFTGSATLGTVYYQHVVHAYTEVYCDGEAHAMRCACGKLRPNGTTTDCDFDTTAGTCSFGSVRIDAAHFPDESIRNAIAAYDENGNGILTSDELDLITTLKFSGVTITSTDGLEYLTSLYHLSMRECSFTDNTLTFSKTLAHITKLDCDFGGLTQLDVGNLPNLTYLSCYGNELTRLDLSDNAMLNDFNCNQNLLVELRLHADAPFTACYNAFQANREVEIDQKTLSYDLSQIAGLDPATVVGAATAGCTVENGILYITESTEDYQRISLNIATNLEGRYISMALVITNPHAHLYILSPDASDDEGHVSVCACGLSVTAAHTNGTYSASEEGHYGACLICGYASSAAEKHTFGEDNICTECLAKEADGVIYLPWSLTDTLPTLGGNYYLTTAVTLNTAVNIADNVTLDLNGKNVTYGNAIAYDYINIMAGGTLNICDLTASAYGTIGQTSTRVTSSIHVHKGGTLNLYSGRIRVYTYSHAIKVSGALHIYGGNLYTTGTTSTSAVLVNNLVGNNPVVNIDNTSGKVSLTPDTGALVRFAYTCGAGEVTMKNVISSAKWIVSYQDTAQDSTDSIKVHIIGGTYTPYNIMQVLGEYIIEDAVIHSNMLFRGTGSVLKLVGDVTLDGRIEIDIYNVEDENGNLCVPLDITEFTGAPFVLYSNAHGVKIAKGDLNRVTWYFSDEDIENDPSSCFRAVQEGEYIVSYHGECFLYYRDYNGDGTHTISCYYCNNTYTEGCTFELVDSTTDRCTVCEGERVHEHTPEDDDGNCTTDILCSICDAVTTKGETAHDYDHACDTTCNRAGCTAGNRVTSHTPEDDDGNCTTDILCSICDAVTTKGETAHSFKYEANGGVVTESCADCTAHTATATISAPAGTLTYDGTTTFEADVQYSDDWRDGTLSVTYTKGGDMATDLTAAGDYTASITVDGKTASTSYTVNRAKVTGPAADTTVFTYTGKAQTYAVAENALYTVSDCSMTDAGSKDITIALVDPANYAWADGTTNDIIFTFTIGKAASVITVDTTPIVKTYGDTWLLPVASSTFGSPVASLTVEQMANAGTYTVTFTVAATENYNGATETLSVTVNRARHDMSGVRFEDATVVYDGAAHAIAITGTLPAGVTVTYTEAVTVVGVHTMTATFSCDTVNYVPISPKTAQLTINHASLSDHIGDTTAPPVASVTMPDGFSPAVEMVVTERDAAGVHVGDAIGKNEEIGAIYAITLQSEGVAVLPSGAVTVRLLIPEALREEGFRIVNHSEDSYTEVAYTTDGDYAVFTTDTLSEFLFVYDSPTNYGWLIAVIVIVLAAGTTVAVVLYRKMKKKAARGT